MPAVLVAGTLYYAELAVSSSAVDETVAIVPTHGGMARLSGLDKYIEGRPSQRSAIPVLNGLDIAELWLFVDLTNAVTTAPNHY